MGFISKLIRVLLIAVVFATLTCSKPTDTRIRIGAVCNDGWRSTATGSGACSHHGGVDYWLYED